MFKGGPPHQNTLSRARSSCCWIGTNFKFTVKGQRTLEREKERKMLHKTHNKHQLLHLIASNYSLHSRVCPSALQIPCNLFRLSRYQQISWINFVHQKLVYPRLDWHEKWTWKQIALHGTWNCAIYALLEISTQHTFSMIVNITGVINIPINFLDDPYTTAN